MVGQALILDLKTALTDGYCHGQSSTNAYNRTAWLRIHPLVFQDPEYANVQDLSGLVAHEMFHVLFCDEHEGLLREMADLADLPEDVEEKYKERVGAAQERLTRLIEVPLALVPVPERVRRIAA